MVVRVLITCLRLAVPAANWWREGCVGERSRQHWAAFGIVGSSIFAQEPIESEIPCRAHALFRVDVDDAETVHTRRPASQVKIALRCPPSAS